ncbi:MAG: LacI family DNA-binding transcriptional regulator [Anaerolineae bacterium]|nr:LacI family DNA-binding transcriptional regulator [Anaerolineae bacterium]
MTAKKRITHRDVARLAGVSTAVVSYVINNGPRPTSPEVRARVLQAIEQLDYHPNALARSLRAQKTHTIGYIATDYYPLDVFTSPYSSGILTGLVAEAKARNYYLLVYPFGVDEDLTQLQQLLRSGRLDGIVIRLVQDPPITDPLISLIASTRTPCVCIEQPADPRFGCCAVTIDDFGGAYQAVQYLIAQGHRRIAHLHGDLRYASARARLAGYRQALSDMGLAVDDQLIYGNTWDPADAAEGTRRLLQLAKRPTAIFAANDSFAFNAVEVLRVAGYRVPDDMALIGFDDIPLAQDMKPALTSVQIPLVELGRKAVELVLCLTDQEPGTPAQSQTLTVNLIRRDTA